MSIMFDENGTLFAAAYVPNSPLYTIDLGTLAASVVGGGDTGFSFPHGGDIFLSADPGTAEVLVKNVAPLIGSVSTSATQGAKGQPGEDVTLAATLTDAGLLDRHGITIDWDDGTLNSIFDVDATTDLSVGDTFASTSGDGATLTVTGIVAATGEVSFSVVHQFATGGIFDVGLTVEDDDTGSNAGGVLAWVTGLRVKDGVLQIIGSNADDHVTVNKQGNGLIKVHAGFLQTGNFETFDADDVQQVLAYLCDGDDHFTIAGNIDLPAIVHGDGGNDHLNAGGGLTVLDGGTGDDHLNGGSGRDILIGGLGADRLVGNGNEDILIDGSTSHDDNDTALLDLLSEWGGADEYAVRVDHLRNGTGLTGIKLALGDTVFHDEDADKLTGSAGLDWLFHNPLEDDASGLKSNELEN